MLQNIKEFEEGLAKLDELEIEFATEYPLDHIVGYLENKLAVDQKHEIEQLMNDNIIFKNRVKFVEYLRNDCGLTQINDIKIACESGMSFKIGNLN